MAKSKVKKVKKKKAKKPTGSILTEEGLSACKRGVHKHRGHDPTSAHLICHSVRNKYKGVHGKTKKKL